MLRDYNCYNYYTSWATMYSYIIKVLKIKKKKLTLISLYYFGQETQLFILLFFGQDGFIDLVKINSVRDVFKDDQQGKP